VIIWQSKAGLTPEFLRDLQDLRRVVEPAAVRLAAERATAQDIADIEAAFAGMKRAVEEGGDYVTHDLRFHQGLLRACHNRMLVQMSKALSALLRTSFEISTTPQGRPEELAAPAPRRAGRGDRAQPGQGREGHPRADRRRARGHRGLVLSSRRRLPRLNAPAPLLNASPQNHKT
jgi:hypothetical protein